MSPVAIGSTLQCSERMATARRSCHRNIIHDPLRACSLFDNGQRLENCTDGGTSARPLKVEWFLVTTLGLVTTLVSAIRLGRMLGGGGSGVTVLSSLLLYQYSSNEEVR